MIKKPSKMILVLGSIAIILACIIRFVIPNMAGVVNINVSSTLTKAIDIAELSTAEFQYRGIAEVYNDEAKTNIRCRICYSAIVKAGIDMEAVTFAEDKENNTIIATLPEINIKVNIIDEKSMAVLPSNAEVNINVMLKTSKEDVEKEARESSELLSTARTNLESTIRALLLPIIKSEGYKDIVFN